LQGLVHPPADAPYLRRIQPVLEKKSRLGTDAWGSVDTGVRHIMEPIEQLFAEEFPDFQPYPWGQQGWIKGLVRHILLAEPLVGDFARCFEGLSPEQAEALADGFAFDQCVRREPLAELLANDPGRPHAGE
jgi:hypothetical protein